jgi:hypothetical protein
MTPVWHHIDATSSQNVPRWHHHGAARTAGHDLFACPNLRARPILPPGDDEEFADYIASALANLPGVLAVSLGGSRATGTNRPDSDWDFSLYYRGHFDPDDLRALGWPGEIFPAGIPTDAILEGLTADPDQLTMAVDAAERLLGNEAM